MTESGHPYDGFISYSHAADDLLAPRLQAALQRFAKPWWRRRALRLFRDESSLSANPHLWSSIIDALDGSEWFVLLLSEEAAQSEWVDREVEYWLENKDPARILPVVTDGSFEWSGSALDTGSTSAPPALRGAFVEEPRWVDLRWARAEEQLDLSNARFRDAVADLASAIRRIPKDELESEEVRQHRRTVRTAVGAGIVVLLLAVAATFGGLLAADRSNEARRQRAEAERQAESARANEQLAREQSELAVERQQAAEEQRRLADAERERAEAEARTSLARALAASSVQAIESDQDRALLLAISAVAATRDAGEAVLPEALDALHLALARHHIAYRIPYGGGPDLAWGPEGKLLLITPEPDSSTGSLLWDLESGAAAAELEGNSPTRGGTWSPLGDLVVTTHKFGEIHLWSAEGGGLAVLDNGRSASSPVIDPTGSLLAVDESGPMVRVWDLESRQERFALDTSPPIDVAAGATASGQGASGPMSFNVDGSLLAIAELEPDGASVWDMSSGERYWTVPIEVGDVVSVAFDPSGSSLATLQDIAGSGRVTVWDVDERVPLATFTTADEPLAMSWSRDGGLVAVGGASRVVEVFDGTDGSRVMAFAGHGATVTSVAFGCSRHAGGVAGPEVPSCEKDTLASSDADGTTLVWDVNPPFAATLDLDDGYVVSAALVGADSRAVVATSAGEVVLIETSPPFTEIQRMTGLRGTGLELNRYGEYEVVTTPPVVVADDATIGAAATPEGRLLAFDPATLGRTETRPRARLHALDATGRVALVENWSPQRLGGECIALCPPVLLDWLTEDVLRSTIATVSDPELSGGFDGVNAAVFSPDGSLVAIAGANQNFRVHEVPPPPEGEVSTVSPAPALLRLATATSGEANAVAFSRDGSLLALAESTGRIRVIDVASLRGSDADGEVVAEFTGMDGPILVVEFTPDGSLLAVSGIGTTVNFWSTTDWSRAYSIDVGGQAASLDFTSDGGTMLTPAGQSDRVQFYPLELDELLALAAERVTRGFTEDECARFLSDRSCVGSP